MEKIIGYCGINCAECDARKATISNDNELREATAAQWRTVFNAPGITSEMINCNGCREEGPKFSHCEECGIKACAMAKGFDTCGDCPELENCSVVAGVLQAVPEALDNLRSLN